MRQAVELLDTEGLRLGRPVNRALAAELLGQGLGQGSDHKS
jgi:hypothetical protein